MTIHSLALTAQVYRYALDFLTSQPTPEQIAGFRPTLEMQSRLKLLISKEQSGTISHLERLELSEYEQIEHLIVMFKAGVLGKP